MWRLNVAAERFLCLVTSHCWTDTGMGVLIKLSAQKLASIFTMIAKFCTAQSNIQLKG